MSASGWSKPLLAMFLITGLSSAVSACGEECDVENHPPAIDWSLTTPAGNVVNFERAAQSLMEFSIEGAVEDPEGDHVTTLWFIEPSSGFSWPLYGELSVVITPCDDLRLRNESEAVVSVAVSDQQIKWTGPDAELHVDTGDRALVMRQWVVMFSGMCP